MFPTASTPMCTIEDSSARTTRGWYFRFSEDACPRMMRATSGFASNYGALLYSDLFVVSDETARGEQGDARAFLYKDALDA